MTRKICKTVINATNVSPDVLIWLKMDNRGYFIERRLNKDRVVSDIFRVPVLVADSFRNIEISDAWTKMNDYCMGVA